MEIATGILSPSEYQRTFLGAVEFLRSGGLEEILVAYGFGCDCPDELLYQDLPISLDRLMSFVAEAEVSDFYRMGRDNLHVNSPDGSAVFLFCHEADIHFTSEDEGLTERLTKEWLAMGHTVRIVDPRNG